MTVRFADNVPESPFPALYPCNMKSHMAYIREQLNQPRGIGQGPEYLVLRSLFI